MHAQSSQIQMPALVQQPAMEKEEEDFAKRLRSVAWELIPLFVPLSRQGLNPTKPVYDPDWPDGRLNLTASAFNQLGQYTSSPGRRGYCYAERAVFFPNGGRDHRQYSLRLPTEGWPGCVGLGGWLRNETICQFAYSLYNFYGVKRRLRGVYMG